MIISGTLAAGVAAVAVVLTRAQRPLEASVVD
jgi:hypothetical protein